MVTIIIPTYKPNKEQKKSKIKLTEIVSKKNLKKNSGPLKIIEDLEKEGFALVISNPPQTYYSVVMPSGDVLDVLRHRELLNEVSFLNPTPEINRACLYYGFYLGYSRQ